MKCGGAAGATLRRVPALLSGASLRRFSRSWLERNGENHWRLTGYSLENTARYIEIQLLRHTWITVITAITVLPVTINEFIRFGRTLPRNTCLQLIFPIAISAISAITAIINETFAKTFRDLRRDIDESLGNLPQVGQHVPLLAMTHGSFQNWQLF